MSLQNLVARPVQESYTYTILGQAVSMRFVTLVSFATYSVNKVTERTGNYYEQFDHRSHAARHRG